MIIDAETHLLPPEFGSTPFGRSPLIRRSNHPERAKVRERVEGSQLKISRTEGFYQKIVSHPQGAQALKLSTPEKLLQSMKQNRIDQSVVIGLPFNDNTLNQKCNRYIYEVSQQYPKHLIGMGVINLNANIKSQVKQFKEEYGFFGLEAIPYYQGVRYDHKVFFTLAEELIKQKMVLMADINFMVSGHEEGNPAYLFGLLKKYPELKTIVSHMGGLLCFHYLYQPIKKYFKNVRFITSVSETMKWVEMASEVLPEDMLIFGTDYPYQPCHDQKTVLSKFKKLKIKESLKRKILGTNFLKFIGK